MTRMTPSRLKHKHLLDFQDWSAEDIQQLLETTTVMAQVMDRTIKKVPALQGFSVGTLFFENSTRTKVSFERAAKALSADVLSFAAGSSSLQKGESLKDTLQTIDAMHNDAYIVRHAAAGVPYQLTQWTDASIINAGDGRRAHPTQALLDAYTFKENYPEFDSFSDKVLTIVGDIAHSRVARSNMELWTKLGANVRLCAPKMLLPVELEQTLEQTKVTLSHDLPEAVSDADAVMVLRLQKERMTGGLLPSLSEYRTRYQVTEALMQQAKPNALLMHPGPINRDVEIAGQLADSPRSVITQQVANGVPVRMAVLYSLLVGKK